MTTNRFKRFVGHSLRPVLIRLLRWTEKSGPLPPPRASLFLHREVRVPPAAVAVAVWSMLSAVLFAEVGPGWRPLAAVLILTTALIAFFHLYLRHDHPELARDEDAVALLGVLLVASALGMGLWFGASRHHAWVSPYGFPLAAVSILAAVLLHPRVAVVLTLVLSLLFGILSAFSLEGALVVCFGGMAGVARSLKVRNRTDVLRAGFWVFLGESAAVGVLAFLERWPSDQALPVLKWVFGGSLFSAILALSLLPFLELFFSRLSNIRLLEISDLNHPLLKEMSVEAPGTLHHSLTTRVGAYFHDVGKLAKPEYFVENQGALGNPHALLPANMSRIVIQSHVKDGLALAQRHNVDRAILDFIAMHHGTSRVEYFYRRAIEQTGGTAQVDEDLFRYPGPKPHTRETAIVMLADSVEASSRTLENPTPQRLADHVNRIVDAKIVDGQCDQVPLTLLEVQEVKASFVSTLAGVYHTRVHYPTSQETDREFSPASRVP